ncbi:MAG: YeeE/YedE family protein [Alphaproteobacteria bacterium]|nr:YeeE/YedE family protein [Alphaproteobacteria bacterium]
MNALTSLLCGLVFGAGLLVSGMTQPPKVLGFLDVLGRWDPTLAFVMGGALVVSGAGFALARRYGGPLPASRQRRPGPAQIDRRLVIGSVLFGAGWGLVGLCPGPALEVVASLSPKAIAFVLAMIAGMAAYDWRPARAAPATASGNEALASSDD